MSFREKMHWVTFSTMVITFGWYFSSYPWSLATTPASIWAAGGMLFVLCLAIIVIMTIASAFLAIRSPSEATMKEDERDRSIHVRGTHLAYYPLVIGIWINIAMVFYGTAQAIQLNLLLGTVVLAELVRIGSQIYLYRRGH
ncbi:MAG: hypothetical protein WBO17_03635 [Sphingorhabdus sp.]